MEERLAGSPNLVGPADGIELSAGGGLRPPSQQGRGPVADNNNNKEDKLDGL